MVALEILGYKGAIWSFKGDQKQNKKKKKKKAKTIQKRKTKPNKPTK